MLKKIDDLNFYELLEVHPTATSQEIHKAYERIRNVYDPNSMALYSLFTPEETARIRQRVEEAYRTLVYDENRRHYDRMLRERHEMPEPVLPRPAPRPAAAQQAMRPDVRPRELFSEPAQTASSEQREALIAEIREFSGKAIKALRESLGLSLRNVADTTKIGSRYLEYIEQEAFAKLPARPYLRGFLILYAKVLGCNPDRLVGDFMKRYDASSQIKPK